MIQEIIRNKYEDCLEGLDIYENRTSLVLPRIIVKEECRGTGVGTQIMNDLIAYADDNKQIVALTPSSDFGGDKNRLIQFYKRFGFKHNKGQYKSFQFRETMIRYPKLSEMVNEDKIKGGKADKMSVKDIADKFDVSVEKIEKEIEMGIKVELEHTDSKRMAKEIAMDHLTEIPDYYTRLKKMEKEGEKEWKEAIKENLRNKLRKFI